MEALLIMANRELVEAIADIICTECDGVSFDSLPETVRYLECRVDRSRAVADKDSARKISAAILSAVFEACDRPDAAMLAAARAAWRADHEPSPATLWRAMLAASPLGGLWEQAGPATDGS